MSRKPTSTPGKRAKTRSQLIEIAAALFLEKGIQNTGLREIARTAGLTKGAIYSSFASKEELVAEVVSATRLALRPAVKPGMSLGEIAEQFAEEAIASMPQVRARAALVAEVELYALTHEGLRRMLEERQALAYREALDLVETLVPPGLPMSPRQVVVMLQALTVGFFQQRTLYPSLVDDEDVRAAYRAVAAALSVGWAAR